MLCLGILFSFLENFSFYKYKPECEYKSLSNGGCTYSPPYGVYPHSHVYQKQGYGNTHIVT